MCLTRKLTINYATHDGIVAPSQQCGGFFCVEGKGVGKHYIMRCFAEGVITKERALGYLAHYCAEELCEAKPSCKLCDRCFDHCRCHNAAL